MIKKYTDDESDETNTDNNADENIFTDESTNANMSIEGSPN